MGLKCKFIHIGNTLSVQNEQGQTPLVYSQALAALKNQEQALRAWAITYTKEFQAETNKTPKTANFDDVVKYYDSAASDLNRLNVEEKYEVGEFMKRTGFSSLSNLNTKLVEIFKPNGVLELNIEAALGSGLYSQEELDEIDPINLINILSKIEGELQLEDIFVTPETLKFNYKDSSRKTVFGTYQKVSETEIDRAILELITDVAQVQDIVQELPYSDFVDAFYSNESFSKKVLERFANLKKIPILRFVGDENGVFSLTDRDISTYTTLKNTLLSNINNLGIESEIEYLQEIDSQLWDISIEEIQQILKEVEKSLLDVNVDIIGLSKYYQDRENVLQLLESVSQVLRDPVELNLQTFAQNYQNVFGSSTSQTQIWEPVEDSYKDLNIVHIESYFNDSILFRDHGLIKIADDTYHKVQRGQINELYDYLYNNVVSNDLIIPKEFRTYDVLENKPQVLSDLTKFVMSRNIGILVDSTLQEEISLNQLAFNHAPVVRFTSNQEDMAALTEIKTNEEYLKSDFISEFYNYILQEKYKDSELYKNTLSAFQITDADISLRYPVSIENLKYSQELSDYFKLKRNTSSKYVYTPSETIVLTDLLYLNHPDLIKNFQGRVIEKNNSYVVTSSTQANFIKIDETTYRKTLSKNNTDLFLPLGLSTDSIYFTTNLNFDFDVEAAQNYLDSVLINVPFDFRETSVPQLSANQILTLPLSKTEINKIRSSLRLKSKDSFTLEILDALSKEAGENFGTSYEEQELFDNFTENGISLNNIANLLVEDDIYDTRREAIRYLQSIGEYKGLASRFSGNIQITQSFLDSDIQLVNLYSEKEKKLIEKNTQDCGG